MRDFGSEQKLANEYELTPGQIRIALAYFNEFKAEIEELLVLGRRTPDEIATRYPFIQTFEAVTLAGG